MALVITNVALVITNVALVITNVALVMYIVYIIVKFQKSNYQSCIGNNQCLNDNNQFRICRYQLLTNWLLPMQDWLLPNVFLARRNNQFSMPYYQCMVLQCWDKEGFRRRASLQCGSLSDGMLRIEGK